MGSACSDNWPCFQSTADCPLYLRRVVSAYYPVFRQVATSTLARTIGNGVMCAGVTSSSSSRLHRSSGFNIASSCIPCRANRVVRGKSSGGQGVVSWRRGIGGTTEGGWDGLGRRPRQVDANPGIGDAGRLVHVGAFVVFK